MSVFWLAQSIRLRMERVMATALAICVTRVDWTLVPMLRHFVRTVVSELMGLTPEVVIFQEWLTIQGKLN